MAQINQQRIRHFFNFIKGYGSDIRHHAKAYIVPTLFQRLMRIGKGLKRKVGQNSESELTRLALIRICSINYDFSQENQSEHMNSKYHYAVNISILVRSCVCKMLNLC